MIRDNCPCGARFRVTAQTFPTNNYGTSRAEPDEVAAHKQWLEAHAGCRSSCCADDEPPAPRPGLLRTALAEPGIAKVPGLVAETVFGEPTTSEVSK